MNKCDIIIPIYNAYECTEACIKSVIKNTNLKENGLILINDKSPDERIGKLLSKYMNNNNITVLENENNLGEQLVTLLYSLTEEDKEKAIEYIKFIQSQKKIRAGF